MSLTVLAVLHALDSVRIQWYHITAIIIGMGFFTDAYDLFCISTVSELLGRLYYYDPVNHPKRPGKLPHNVNNAVLGRKRVYGFTLILMVICAICSGLSFGYSSKAAITALCFFRFWLGFGIGGDYPLSATIMSEYANKKTCGAFIAAVFAMQGVGIIFAGLVSMILSNLFLIKYETVPFQENPVLSTQREADRANAWSLSGAFNLILENENARDWSVHCPCTMNTWFLLDIAFYSQNQTQRDIFPAMNLVNKDYQVSALRERMNLRELDINFSQISFRKLVLIFVFTFAI
ncbi:hypothetical protein PVL29_021578 [Vitis rotundifolia]|uniref:Major facilitator superfamily (MFS) profile domain-containing protein n=1 Tax=Vitis rotundifolia TaxID=103349 RepID=A0AA39DEX3_VITRO|nr:hypothetical protein PVL29_021578 [Vitis rotundifolia]